MNDQTSDLLRIEGWMQAVVTHPEGVRRGIACENARRNIDVAASEIENVVTRSKALAALDRLAIYSRAYHARLLECLRTEFPVLLHALGAELFNRFAFDYLERHPSRTYTLARLGENFPRYLAETRPDHDAPLDERESWPDFIIDLAALERQFSEVFDGPGVEGQPLVAERELSELFDSKQLPQARFVTVPCLRLMIFRYPIINYFLATKRNENPDLPDPAMTFLALTRRDYSVFLYELSRQQYELLSHLIAREPVAQAINRAAAAIGCEQDRLADNLPDWLESWLSLGFFSSIECKNEADSRQ